MQRRNYKKLLLAGVDQEIIDKTFKNLRITASNAMPTTNINTKQIIQSIPKREQYKDY